MSLSRPASFHTLTHAGAVVSYIAIFCWVFAKLLFTDAYLAESDLQDWYLPVFLAPIERWSNDLVAGFPVFVDFYDNSVYPVHFLFARVFGWWAGYVISGYVLGASFMYAYVFAITRSRTAAFFSGLAFGLSEAMLERQAHINIVHSFAWMPLIVLAVDRIVVGGSAKWIAIGAFAVANSLIGGHPQPPLYVGTFCVVYAIAGGLSMRAAKQVYVRVAAIFVLGVLITAIKSLPFIEATRYAARDIVNFDRFLTASHSAMQLLGVLFPTIQHNGREAPLYVGLVVLPLAVLGAASQLKWRARVWVAAAVFALLVSAGTATPVARLAYELPLYDRFRVGSRILILFTAGAATLAGFGIAALQRHEASRRAIALAVGLTLGALGAGALLLANTPGQVTFLEGESTGWNLPIWSGGVWLQFGIGILSAAAVLCLSRVRGFRVGVAFTAIVLAADLLVSLPYPITPTGLVLNVFTKEQLGPSIHARRLAAQTESAHQRFLAFGGTSGDPLVPPGFARLWHIPIAGGYTQVLPQWLLSLIAMGTNGDVKADALTFENRTLDLLGVRYLTVQDNDFPAEPTFERRGITWARTPLDLPLGRADCGQLYARTVSLPLPPDVEISAIALVAHVRCGDQVAQGTEAARIELIGPGGTVMNRSLVIGVDISERDLRDPPTRDRARHKPTDLFDDPALMANQSFVRLDLPQPVRGGRLLLHGAAMHGWTSLERLTFIDTSGRSIPQRLGPLLVSDTERWREDARFRTSRLTDRKHEESSPDEHGIVVYENRRALPRAWIVPKVAELASDDIVSAVVHSALPDGSAFDPLELALVEPGGESTSPQRKPSTSNRADARVTSIEDSRIVVDVSSDSGGFLVLSELYYPGWRARIENRTVEVQRTDGTLQGVALPAGQHTVVFEFVSWSLRIGSAVTIAAAIVACLLLWRGEAAPRLERGPTEKNFTE